MVEVREVICAQSCGLECELWGAGFCYGERKSLTISPEELLSLEVDQVRSKGQILRSMIRQARANPS